MMLNLYGEPVYSQSDLCDLAMSGKQLTEISGLTVDHTVNIEQCLHILENANGIHTWRREQDCALTVEQFDQQQQQQWHMPVEYQQLDVAAHIVNLCETPEQLQRVGEELLLYQERGLFDLLRYLKYLVDVMKSNNVIWGVGRGSSVASYVLYLLGVHRIDSMFYDLDPREFLR
jgi:DNA polymerase III alpha subunit